MNDPVQSAILANYLVKSEIPDEQCRMFAWKHKNGY